MANRADSITIDRPVHEVWAYVTDVTNDPAWHTDILEAWMKIMSPIMGMMLPKQNKGFLANLKRVLEERPA
jgi:hypothetical protein